MTIPQIKKQLSILQVLAHYGIDLGRNDMIVCPFHEDEKPSMKIYTETNTVFCFAGGCTIDSMDVIDFIMQMENLTARGSSTKYEAILKAKTLVSTNSSINPIINTQATMTSEADRQSQYEIYRKSLRRHKDAQAYCQQRSLDWQQLDIGYKSKKTADKWGRTCLIFPLRNASDEIVSFYGRSIYSTSIGKHFYQTSRSGLYPGYPSK